jgi:hypothetical protein
MFSFAVADRGGTAELKMVEKVGRVYVVSSLEVGLRILLANGIFCCVLRSGPILRHGTELHRYSK